MGFSFSASVGVGPLTDFIGMDHRLNVLVVISSLAMWNLKLNAWEKRLRTLSTDYQVCVCLCNTVSHFKRKTCKWSLKPASLTFLVKSKNIKDVLECDVVHWTLFVPKLLWSILFILLYFSNHFSVAFGWPSQYFFDAFQSQSRIQNPVKHLRWRHLRKKFKAYSR